MTIRVTGMSISVISQDEKPIFRVQSLSRMGRELEAQAQCPTDRFEGPVALEAIVMALSNLRAASLSGEGTRGRERPYRPSPVSSRPSPPPP